jgi:hypothetical protein
MEAIAGALKSDQDHILDLGAGEGIFSRQLAGIDECHDLPSIRKIPKVTMVSYEAVDPVHSTASASCS